ncbi:MAG: M3 family metallopeptidase [bacterium]|nr:M3 family metallopeptidase [bacterium]
MDHPFLDRSFLIRWSQLTPDRVVPAVEHALTAAGEAIAAITRLDPAAAAYANTFLALEDASDLLNETWAKVTHLTSVSDSPALRDAHNAMLPKVSAFFARIPLNPDLWLRLKAAAAHPSVALPGNPAEHGVPGTNAPAQAGGRFPGFQQESTGHTGPAAGTGAPLRGEHRRFVDETMAEFRQNGADLPPDKKARLEAVQAELASLTQKYSENVLDATNAWELVLRDETRLRGLPPHARESARQNALKKGQGTAAAPAWRFTLHGPSLEPVLLYAEDAALRREVWSASAAVGVTAPQDNRDLIKRILSLRQEKAALLGRPHFADLVLERRMAKSGATALAFIEDLHARVAPAFARETSELAAFKAEQTKSATGPLAPWETAFWAERLRRSRYDFDEEQLRPYFPMSRVLAGMFEITSRVFGIRVTERPAGAVETWHPEVKFYDVHDEAGRHLGSFYADWHPRESKRGGAWMNYLITGGRRPDGTRAPHLGLMCGNMTPPMDGKPALLTHREVETVFHEFGHLLHLGEGEIKSLNGTNVAWDFVELPSQIMENWCWERASLDLFARHHETGAAIPEQLFSRLVAAKNFRSASATMRQLAFSRMDLELHLHPAAYVDGEVSPKLQALLRSYLMPTEPPAPTIENRFTHIFSDPTGYAAGYYSYKWAEVLDADAFTRFKREGIFNRATGAEFVAKILSRGNSADPMQLFVDFMGRPPDQAALLARAGLG